MIATLKFEAIFQTTYNEWKCHTLGVDQKSAVAPVVRDIRIFVPAKDFDVSLAYYLALGCRCNWREDSLAELELADTRLFLQNFYVREWAENFMIHLTVEDANAWYQHIHAMVDSGEYPGIRVNPPKPEPYGARVTYAWDPSGVLLHLAQPH